MKMKISQLFQFEAVLKGKVVNNTMRLPGITTKYWPLLKILDSNYNKMKPHLETIRERLKQTEKIEAYNRAVGELQQKMKGKPQEEIDAALNKLEKEHSEAAEEIRELVKLEKEILKDTIELDLEPIPEDYFHDRDNLRIETEHFFFFSELGLITDPVPVAKKSKSAKKKRKK